MRRFRLILSLCFWAALLSPAHAVVERRTERVFPAGPNASFALDATSGDVNVRPVSDTKEIVVNVLQAVEGVTPEDAERLFGMLALDFENDGGRVKAGARFRRGIAWAWEDWPPVTLTFEVLVPEACDVDIRVGDGAITVGSLKGRAVLLNTGGAIFAQEIDGSFKARSRGGAIALAACTGDIEATTDTGSITVGRAAGRTMLRSRGGFMEIQRASGRVVVRGDGSNALVGFVAPVREAADIVLSGGTLTLRLDNDIAGTLDVRSSVFGSIELRGELPLSVTAGGVGKSRLRGDVNGGGPVLAARARGGSVLLRALDPVPVE